MIVKDHIEAVGQHEDYKGNDPSYPGTYDVYTEYGCVYCDSESFTLDSNLDPSFELEGRVKDHLKSEHPEVLE